MKTTKQETYRPKSHDLSATLMGYDASILGKIAELVGLLPLLNANELIAGLVIRHAIGIDESAASFRYSSFKHSCHSHQDLPDTKPLTVLSA